MVTFAAPDNDTAAPTATDQNHQISPSPTLFRDLKLGAQFHDTAIDKRFVKVGGGLARCLSPGPCEGEVMGFDLHEEVAP